MTFSVHAVERYIERCCGNRTPRPTMAAALLELKSLVDTARPHGHTPVGDRQLLARNGVRLVVRRARSGDLCTTVLGPEDRSDPDAPDVTMACDHTEESAREAVIRYMKGRANRGDRRAERLLEQWFVAMGGGRA